MPKALINCPKSNKSPNLVTSTQQPKSFQKRGQKTKILKLCERWHFGPPSYFFLTLSPLSLSLSLSWSCNLIEIKATSSYQVDISSTKGTKVWSLFGILNYIINVMNYNCTNLNYFITKLNYIRTISWSILELSRTILALSQHWDRSCKICFAISVRQTPRFNEHRGFTNDSKFYKLTHARTKFAKSSSGFDFVF